MSQALLTRLNSIPSIKAFTRCVELKQFLQEVILFDFAKFTKPLHDIEELWLRRQDPAMLHL